MEQKQQEKFECMECGCYFWVEDRDGFECPNCKQIELDNQENVKFTYLSQPPKRYTFEQPRLRIWTESWCKGKVLNLFAGTTKLNVNEFRVDINKDMIADFYGDAFEFIQTTELKFDTIVFDPPYNLRKAREKYKGEYIGSDTKIKNVLKRILNPNCRVISFGYNSVGMSKSRGFEKKAICLVCHNGNNQDTVCLVEELKDNGGLFFSSQP